MCEIYKDSNASPAERTEDLLSRMTLSQKLHQLIGLAPYTPSKPEAFKEGMGHLRSFGMPLPLEQQAEIARETHKMVVDSSPLPIPAMVNEEALTGVLASGCTIFPTSISLGATFSPDDVQEMADIIRQELLNLGIRQTFGPVLDLARDFRWGRTGEDYSSDPTLVSAMACAYVKGMNGTCPQDRVLATTKHFLGYSTPEGGLNSAKIHTDWQDIRENYSKPFEAAIRLAGLQSVMNSYGEFEGEPVCSSKRILTDLLRKEMGFTGTVVSDYTSVRLLVESLKTAETPCEAAQQCLSAGLDVEPPNGWAYTELEGAVERGEFDEAIIDDAVRRVLMQKFELGLFEGEPPFRPVPTAERDAFAQKVTDKVVTLLKNDGVLPLPADKKIAVIGPTGNSIRLLNNGYSWPSNFEMVLNYMQNTGVKSSAVGLEDAMEGLPVAAQSGQKIDILAAVDARLRKEHPTASSILDGMLEFFGDVRYVQGCPVRGESEDGFAAALQAAREADVVVLTVGGHAGFSEVCTGGEGHDNVSIRLPGVQEELLRAVYEANPNLVIVHTDVKPLVCPFAYEHARAVIEAWMPGIFGGHSIAAVIAGQLNPGGRLPVDVPRDGGQTPLYYYQHNHSRKRGNPYGTCPVTAQLPFGFGLSYTEFAYRDFEYAMDESGDVPVLTVRVRVKNTGGMAGDETVQLYGIDEVGSLVRPEKQLVGFYRLHLAPGEEKCVTFQMRLDQLAFPDREKVWRLEKGNFTFQIAKNAEEVLNSYQYRLPATMVIDHTKRGFWAQAEES